MLTDARETHSPPLNGFASRLLRLDVEPPGAAGRRRFRDVADHDAPSVTVVLPARNEERNIAAVLDRIPHWINEIVLVDGHSTDATVTVAEAAWPGIRIVHQTSKGKGGALIEGFKAASSDIIVMLDADGSTDPAEIPRFIGALRTGGDLAKGTRFVAGGGSADITSLRAAGNRCLLAVVNLCWHHHHTDLCYGYMAFWRRCLDDIVIDCEGFEIETLIVLRFLRANVRIIEVPSYEHPRLSGLSNLSAFHDGMRILRTIASERLRPPKQI
jgi:glycosyltransferase involved in cell wall biosynthesis